ncbi:MAG: type II secretion system protein [Pseudomonadota bacterium]
MKVRNQKGFTLLELLVVVTILAVISGVVISSLGGQEERAGQGAASNAMAALEDGIRIFRVTEDRLPGELESLLCADGDAAAAAVSAQAIAGTPVLADGVAAADDEIYVFGGSSNVPGVGGGLAADYADKIAPYQLTADLSTVLVDSGIDTLRYVTSAACDNNTTTATTDTINTVVVGDDNLVDYETPLLAFDSVLNEGLGFSAPVEVGTPVAVLLEPQEIGADPAAVVLLFGIGQSSQLVSGDNAILGKAPFEGNVGRDKYAHYALALQVCDDCATLTGTVPDTSINLATLDADLAAAAADEDIEAEISAVLDADADFLLEEYAEFTGNSDE